MLRRVAKSGLIVSLVLSIGLHWAFLQSAAWVGMLVTYTAKSGSISQAASDTFDGRHPCKLCHLVEEGQKSQQDKQQKGKDLKKLDLAITETPQFFGPVFPKQHPIGYLLGKLVRTHSPTHGPPRSATFAA